MTTEIDVQTDAPAQDAEATEETTAPADETFEGEFNPDRARRLIDKLRGEVKQVREQGQQQVGQVQTEAEQKVADLQGQVIRERVGRRLEMPDEFVELLQGSTEDEVIDFAQKLMDAGQRMFTPKASPTRKPTEALRAGLDPEAPAATDMNALIRRGFGRA